MKNILRPISLAVVLALALSFGLVAVPMVRPVEANAVIYSNWATTVPTIDGVYGPDEWSDAAVVDLQAADPDNEIEAYVYFKNDAGFLYVLIDVAGDTTEGEDESTLSFDTGHDAAHTDGHDDTFSWHFEEWDHWVWDSTAGEHVPCCHFDPTLPLHAGLAGAMGFGSSPNSGTNHVIYEYQIPLPLILASPGDTIGFAMDGEREPFLGIYDNATERGDQWPFLRWGPISIDEYGDLILAASPGVVVGGTVVEENTLELLALVFGSALLFVLAICGGVLALKRRQYI